MESVLKVNSLSKKIKNNLILDSIDMEMKSGEIIALIGPNGAGKTTILKNITGLSKMSSGSVNINGFSLSTDYKKAINKVGALIEEPEFYNNLTGKQNLKLFSRMNTNKISDSKINELAESLGILTALNKKVSTYSLGMRQRLGICETLLGNPNVLLLDEPLNGLDPNGIIQVKSLIQKLSPLGVAILISSHQLSEL